MTWVDAATDVPTIKGLTATDHTAGGAQGRLIAGAGKMYAVALTAGRIYQWNTDGTSEAVSGASTVGALMMVSVEQIWCRNNAGTGILRIIETSFPTVAATNNAAAGITGIACIYNPGDGNIWLARGSAPYGIDKFNANTLALVSNVVLPGATTLPNTLIYDSLTAQVYCETNTNFIYTLNASTGAVINGFKTTAPSGAFIGINTTRRQLLDGSGTTGRRYAL